MWLRESHKCDCDKHSLIFLNMNTRDFTLGVLTLAGMTALANYRNLV